MVDEGVLQRLAYVLAATGAPHSPEVERPEVLPRVDGVIALDLPLDLAVSRVRERALARSWEFQSTEVMPAMATAVAHIAQVLGDNGGCWDRYRRHPGQVMVSDRVRYHEVRRYFLDWYASPCSRWMPARR